MSSVDFKDEADESEIGMILQLFWKEYKTNSSVCVFSFNTFSCWEMWDAAAVRSYFYAVYRRSDLQIDVTLCHTW